MDAFIDLIKEGLAKEPSERTAPAFNVMLPSIGTSFSEYPWSLSKVLLLPFYPVYAVAEGKFGEGWALWRSPDAYSVKSPALKHLMGYLLSENIGFEVTANESQFVGQKSKCMWCLTLIDWAEAEAVEDSDDLYFAIPLDDNDSY